jgi:RNA polymerase sigma factor (TIGR02999 family)
LVGSEAPGWEGRRHFFGAAAEAMRRILIERALRKKRVKHGGHLERVVLDEVDVAGLPPDEELLAVDEALDRLASMHASAAALVKLRFFVGLTHAQAAECLGISRQTADNRWAFAKAWLFRELKLNME